MLSVWDEVQAQNMTGHGQVDGIGGILRRSALDEPGVIFLQQADIFLRPMAGGAGTRRIRRQALIAGILRAWSYCSAMVVAA